MYVILMIGDLRSLLTTVKAMLISPLRSSSCSRWRPRQPCLLFLLPHPEHSSPPFSPSSLPRPFSNSSPCSSRTGATPISVPAEVQLRLLPPKTRKVITRIQPNQVLEVEGPLGGSFSFVLYYYFFCLEGLIDLGVIWGGQVGEVGGGGRWGRRASKGEKELS